MVITFQGKYGDILWAMASVQALAVQHKQRVHVRIGELYGSLCALLQYQPYVATAGPLVGWTIPDTEPPIDAGLAEPVVHLGHRVPVGPNIQTDIALIDLIARNAGLPPGGVETPFLVAPPLLNERRPHISVGFSEYEKPAKDMLYHQLCDALDGKYDVVRTEHLSWLDAAAVIKGATLHVGCRSALNVLAHGLARPVVTFEPIPYRRPYLYSCPYGVESLHADAASALVEVLDQLEL